MKQRAPSLTLKRLHAISEALAFRLAGPIEDYGDDDDDMPVLDDYERAQDWVWDQIAKRGRKW